MDGQSVLREVKLTLPMSQDLELSAVKTVASVAGAMQMSPDKIDEVRQAVVEAFINAREYSHAEDGLVYMTFTVLGETEPQILQVKVRDTGRGFDPTGVEKPDIGAKIGGENKRGWGLTIIRGLMDDVKIESGSEGTTVTMSKAR